MPNPDLKLTPESQALVDAVQAAPPFWKGRVEDVRLQMAEFAKALAPGPELFAVSDVTVPGAASLTGRRYAPGADAPAQIVYLHGGGWVFGSVDESDAVCRHLARATQCEVLSINYRLAPEYPFPAAVEDAMSVLRWLDKADDRPTFVMGDSAGGNLAAVASQGARDAGLRPLAGQILIYPVTSAAMASASYRDFAEGLTIGADAMRWFFDLYIPDRRVRRDWRCSPLEGALAGLPPALVLTAEYDVLRDEGEAYARALQAAGVAVTLERMANLPHGFFTLVGWIPEALILVDTVARWTGQLLAPRAANAG